MKDWENYCAGSLIYQDLADCSLGSVPVLSELEQTETSETEKIVKQAKKKKDENVIIVEVLPKASAFFFLILALVTTV